MSDNDVNDLKLILWAIGDLAGIIARGTYPENARNCAKAIVKHLEFVGKIIDGQTNEQP